ncbi:ribbon-helix-helix protein, CopG family [Lactiplantibacillus pentosus]|nr:ribbon-helix-helix protein, CopG family [Lactiplantibacillus pentosus]MDT6966735.1 ribbon-helix-helix protein, CopG family [Lactiplantibacillus pentosus]MDT6999605.1 ribbon-helix-helix protein, CopG family [Lactiplantibacillus pentosus]
MTQDITIHFDEATDALLDAYTIEHHISKPDFIKQAVAERLAD